MKQLFSLCFIFFALPAVNAQTKLTTMGVLPQEISESSGIELGAGDTYWTHNDKGDQPWLYQINSEGKLIRKVFIKNVAAKDLEDITIEENKFMYVGDFGNNKNNRKDLVIYKISLETLNRQDSVTTQSINFKYQDQHEFPPNKSNKNFDCEAFFWNNGFLYLFTKNRGENGYTKCYKLTDSPGNHIAKLIDSFKTGSWVTSADLSPSGKKMALLCGPVLYVFSDFKQDLFFKGKFFKTVLAATQKEAVVFKEEDKLIITDEKNNKMEGLLYSLSTKDERVFSIHQEQFVISPSPIDKELLISYTSTDAKEYLMEIKQMDDYRTVIKENINVYPNYFRKQSLNEFKDGQYQIIFSNVKDNYFLKLLFTINRE